MAARAHKQHLELFNPAFSKQETYDSFHQFSQLPFELRRYVWQLALSHWRFIHIVLDVTGLQNPTIMNEHVGKQGEYTVKVQGRQTLSRFLRISRESRYVTLLFYRVHLPCQYEWGGETALGTFYLNPDWDILHILPAKHPTVFADFILDVKTQDKRDIGLQHLALQNWAIYTIEHTQMSKLGSSARQEAFINALSGIRHLFFLSLDERGRMFDGLRSDHDARRWTELHRSRPIFGVVPTLNRLLRDPRPISKELKRVYTGHVDTRKMIFAWLKLLDSWGAPQAGEYRYLITCVPRRNWPLYGGKSITNRSTAMYWIEKEDRIWTNVQEKNSEFILGRGGRVPVETPEELEHAPQPVIGFWSFPVEALGPLPDRKLDEHETSRFWKYKRLLDFSNHWPELWVGIMPE